MSEVIWAFRCNSGTHRVLWCRFYRFGGFWWLCFWALQRHMFDKSNVNTGTKFWSTAHWVVKTPDIHAQLAWVDVLSSELCSRKTWQQLEGWGSRQFPRSGRKDWVTWSSAVSFSADCEAETLNTWWRNQEKNPTITNHNIFNYAARLPKQQLSRSLKGLLSSTPQTVQTVNNSLSEQFCGSV